MTHSAHAAAARCVDTPRVARIALAAALVVLAAALVAPAALPAGQGTRSSLASGLLAQVNAVRAEHHLAPLKANARLEASASQHTQEMLADGYFAHESADGTTFWTRIARWYAPKGGGRAWSVGENLLWSSPDVSSAGALRIWMASPPHRANLLDPRWREIGLAALHAAHAPGVFGGHAATIVTADFGVRR
jgi:uncharacterized protein YkwD